MIADMNQVEFLVWMGGNFVGFRDAASLGRWAQIHQKNTLKVWHADFDTQSVYLTSFSCDDGEWYWEHVPTGQVRRISMDSSYDPIALTIIEMFEGDSGHKNHQIVIQYRADEWPPEPARAIDPTGRWAGVGILPPFIHGEPDDDSIIELHYCPERLAEVFRRVHPNCDPEDAEAMAGTLLWRHSASIARAELPFEQREREADDAILETGGYARDLLIELLTAGAGR